MTSVVDAAQRRDGGGQPPRQQLGRLPVIFWFGSQQGDDVLQVARGLQPQSVHHVTQVVCGRGTEDLRQQSKRKQMKIIEGRLVSVPMSVASCLVEQGLS